MNRDAEPTFCTARKGPLPLDRKMNQTIVELIFLGMLVLIDDGGVQNIFFCDMGEKGLEI